jgi:hypothetical protein
MLRDFSQEEKERLLAEVANSEAEHEKWYLAILDSLTDPELFKQLQYYVDDVETYRTLLIDIKNESAEQIEAIWADVSSIDATYTSLFTEQKARLAELAGKIELLGAALNPNGPDGSGHLLLRPLSDIRGYMDSNFGEMDYERENDRWMQDQLFALLDDEYSRDVWNAIGTEGARFATREEFLQSLYDDAQRIMGTNASPDIDFATHFCDDPYTINAAGFYRHSDNTVRINIHALNAEECSISVADWTWYDPYDLASTVFHELRHTYQYETIDNSASHPFVSDATRTAWENNFGPDETTADKTDTNYRTTAQDGRAAYLNQPVEFDAFSFARQYSQLEGYLNPVDWLDWQQDYINEGMWP